MRQKKSKLFNGTLNCMHERDLILQPSNLSMNVVVLVAMEK
jgi:hypothetical protein